MEKTIVIAQAIKTHFWKDVYLGLSRSDNPFELVFVGHIKPNFKLPKNMHWIDCSLSPAACAEIAYRYAYKKFPEAKYIVNISDDLLLPENFIEDNIAFYKRKKKETKADILLTGPICLLQHKSQNLMAWGDGGPALLVTNFTEIETSKRIGGIDKNFQAIYWDCDRMLRAHAMGGKIIIANLDEMPPTREREHIPGLLKGYKHIDMVLLDEIWDISDGGDNLVNCGSIHLRRNIFSEKNKTLKRLTDVEEYSQEEIGKYYE